MQATHSNRHVQRVRHEVRMRQVSVASVEPLGPEFVRIVFSGESLSDFVSLGFDDHVKFMTNDSSGSTVRRDYTPRRFDPVRQLLTIDFAIHGDGMASDWARQAAVGQAAVIGGPRGSMIAATDHDWHLLVGDATAVPAIGRRLAELPANAHAIVVAQIEDPAPLELEQCHARIDLQRVSSSDEMIAALRAMNIPQGTGYAWAAGEASIMKRVRELLLVEKEHPRNAMRVAAYWKHGASDHHEELGS